MGHVLTSSGVLVRVDASSTIGLGHLSRCLTLAGAFAAAGAPVSFATSATSDLPTVKRLVGRYPLHTVLGEPGSPADFEETSRLARSVSEGDVGLVLVDGYHFREPYLQRFRDTGLFGCFFDDMMDLSYPCQAVFNQNFSARPELFRASAETELILGPSYALIRDEFVTARKARPACRPEAARVLLTMGGADPTRETEKCLASLAALRRPLTVRVVVGASNPRADAIRAAASRAAPHGVEVLVAISNMAEQMQWCDVAITAAGTTCMELLCVGVPSLNIVVVDNQRRIGPVLGELGLMVALGWHEDVTPAHVAVELERLLDDRETRERLSAAGRSAVDGEGKRKTVERLRAAVLRHEAT